MAPIIQYSAAIIIALLFPFGISKISIRAKHSYLSIASDLDGLASHLSMCHLHIVLFETDINLELVGLPHYLTLPKLRKPTMYEFSHVGENIVRNVSCMATIFVLMKDHGILNERECMKLQHFILMRQLKGTALSSSYDIVLQQSPREPSMFANTPGTRRGFCGTYNFYGSTITFVLRYSRSMVAIRTGWLICNHCPQSVVKLPSCNNSTAVQCVSLAASTYENMVQGGRHVLWYWLVEDTDENLKYIRNTNPPQFCPFQQKESDGCTRKFSEAALHMYMTHGCNRSVQLQGQEKTLEVLLPTYGLIFDVFGSKYGLAPGVANAHNFPVKNLYEKRDSLKFITLQPSQIGYILSAAIYIEPFQVTVWILLIFTIIATMLLLLCASFDNKKVIQNLQRIALWVLGVFLDQVNPLKIKSWTVHFVAHCLFVFFVFFVGNLYKGVFNASYVTRSHHESPWKSLNDLKNFTFFFALASYNLKELTAEGVRKVAYLYNFCDETYEGDAINAAACKLENHFKELSYVHFNQPDCFDLYGILLEKDRNADQLYECASKTLNDFSRIYSRAQYFKYEDFDEIIVRNLTRFNAAFVTTEQIFPFVWQHFERAMEENPGVQFIHNYNSAYDSTLPKRKTKMCVQSGLDPRFTTMITRRAHSLLFSGIWNEWTELVELNKRQNVSGFGTYESDFEPLSLGHDAVSLIFTASMRLYVIILAVFLANILRLQLKRLLLAVARTFRKFSQFKNYFNVGKNST